MIGTTRIRCSDGTKSIRDMCINGYTCINVLSGSGVDKKTNKPICNVITEYESSSTSELYSLVTDIGTIKLSADDRICIKGLFGPIYKRVNEINIDVDKILLLNRSFDYYSAKIHCINTIELSEPEEVYSIKSISGNKTFVLDSGLIMLSK